MTAPLPLKRRGPKVKWNTKITAPPEALALYALIASLQQSDAFNSCHIYHGALLDGVPMVKFKGEVTGLPHVVASYLGLHTSDSQCRTPGCCNPFHYLAQGDVSERLIQVEEISDRVLQPGVEDWLDLIEYAIEENRIRSDVPRTFDLLRPLIPVEDLSDAQLEMALKSMA